MTATFGKWQARLWPVHKNEYWKLLPLLFMKFFASFNFVILQATKDTLVVTGKGSGAEVIPILKGGVVLGFAFLATVIYAKLSNILTRTQLFYAAIFPFLIFFALYGFVLYPNRELLSPQESADWLVSLLGKSREHWVVVYRYWTESLFFLMAELWGGIVIALLFWGFANRMNSLSEASRFYNIFSAGGHVGVICSSPLIWFFATTYGPDDYGLTVKFLMTIVTGATAAMMFAFWWLNKKAALSSQESQKKKRSNESLQKNLLYVLKSPYLGCIALMVIGYGLSVNIIEVTWKAILKIQYPHSADYQAFMGIVAGLTGVVSLLLALFVGGNVIRRLGWYTAAQSTPLVLGLGTALFLTSYFFVFSTDQPVASLTFGAINLVVITGAIHNVLCKSMKYCLFDTTKEMAYIPLDEESQVKGKAAVDVVSARFGKSGSSWLQAGLLELVGTGSILSITSYLAPFVIVAMVAWMLGVRYLRKLHFAVTEGLE